MIRIPRRALPPALLSALADLQRSVDGQGAYDERVAAALRSWDNKPRKTFDKIRTILKEMCSGALRCMYCEDSAARDIEHFRPKALYPEVAYAWSNYLLACGGCNGPEAKGDDFGVVTWKSAPAPRSFVNNSPPRRGRQAPPPPRVPPAPGTPLLINPRREDPLRLLRLDLFPPFHFQPSRAAPCLDLARAVYTIEKLGLNRRDELTRGREIAYGNYLSEMEAYLRDRDGGADGDRLRRRRERIRGMPHRTVFREMVRQQEDVPELKSLFAAEPDMLRW